MIVIYITDLKDDRIILYECPAPDDVEAFEKEMTEIYEDAWFYDIFDALKLLTREDDMRVGQYHVS